MSLSVGMDYSIAVVIHTLLVVHSIHCIDCTWPPFEFAIVPNKEPHKVAATKHSSPVYTSHAQLTTCIL